ncbi:MAG: Lrp/AsnC family transcriptional regulator [Methanobacterium sp.]|jgi:DNA-binding Lrp family transcriptional regulator
MNNNKDDDDYGELLFSVDEIDRKIINLFQYDGRMSYRKIAKELDISIGTVHNRIDKLTKNGVIKKFTPVIDHKKLGYALTTVIGVRVKGGVLKNWEDRTAYHKNVLCVYDVTGEFDAILIARFKDTQELDQFVKGLLKEPDVQRTYTQTVLNIVKEDLNSGDMFIKKDLH